MRRRTRQTAPESRGHENNALRAILGGLRWRKRVGLSLCLQERSERGSESAHKPCGTSKLLPFVSKTLFTLLKVTFLPAWRRLSDTGYCRGYSRKVLEGLSATKEVLTGRI